MIATRQQEPNQRTARPIEPGQNLMRRAAPTPVPDILTDVQRSLRAEAKLVPHQSNWASTLMDPCERRLVYQRTQWDKAQLPELRLQGIFETGKRLEKLVLNILNEIGADSHPLWELLRPTSRAKDNLLTQYHIGGIPDCFCGSCPRRTAATIGTGRDQDHGPPDLSPGAGDRGHEASILDPEIPRPIDAL